MKNRWSDQAAARYSSLELLVYRSQLIGADPKLVIWGGGNTSVKMAETDFRGRQVRVLRIKGSGTNLATATAKDFPGLYLDDLLPLYERDRMSGEDMAEYLNHCLLDPASPRPSVETLLHAFIPFDHVDHTHAEAVLALVNHPNSREIIRHVYGNTVALVPYTHPGFLLAKRGGMAVRAAPHLQGLILDKHGLVTFGRTARESYARTIRLVRQAEGFLRRKARHHRPLGGERFRPLPADQRRRLAVAIAPRLRGMLSEGTGRMVLEFDDSPAVLSYVNSRALARVSQKGTATPDHVIHIKPWPLIAPVAAAGDDRAFLRGTEGRFASYARRYTSYFKRNAPKGSVMDPPVPRVVLIPRLGMFTSGKDAKAARVAHDLMVSNSNVQTLGSALGQYATISPKDMGAFEYWPNERYKLTLLPAELELARQVAFVTGAASGIGRACARRLAQAGAHVVLADLNLVAARREASELCARYGHRRALAVHVDVTSERSVRQAVAAAVLAYGGIDLIVSNAGIAHAAAVDVMHLKDWERSMAVNATGHFLIAREILRVLKAQGRGGAMVFIGTKNVAAPGAQFGAYSAAKAAEVQLARVLALEAAAHGIRVNVVNPDAIFRDSGLWSDDIKKQRARAHGVPIAKLQDFYASRNLLKRPVYAEDVAEAALFLLSERSSKTTGAQLPVDGGVPPAFPR